MDAALIPTPITDEERKKSALDYAETLIAPYGYVLVKYDRILRFGTQSVVSGMEWDYTHEYREQMKERSIARMGQQLGQEIVTNGFVKIEDVHTGSGGRGWRAEVLVIKPREERV